MSCSINKLVCSSHVKILCVPILRRKKNFAARNGAGGLAPPYPPLSLRPWIQAIVTSFKQKHASGNNSYRKPATYS